MLRITFDIVSQYAQNLCDDKTKIKFGEFIRAPTQNGSKSGHRGVVEHGALSNAQHSRCAVTCEFFVMGGNDQRTTIARQTTKKIAKLRAAIHRGTPLARPVTKLADPSPGRGDRNALCFAARELAR